VLFSTHVMQHAERLCDKVVLMARGRKVFDGDVATARCAAPRALVLEGGLAAKEVAALPGNGRGDL
jgi:ABC-2 type transport system ATP-binding protein